MSAFLRLGRFLWLLTILPTMRSTGAPPPGSTPVGRMASVPAILRQDGAGLPTAWGREDGWEAPAWYRLAIPAGADPAGVEQQLGQAMEALPHLFLDLDQEDLYGREKGLYLHTQDRADYYARRGWTPLESFHAWGAEHTLMWRALDGAA